MSRTPLTPAPSKRLKWSLRSISSGISRRKDFRAPENMFVSQAIFDRVGGFRSGVAEDRDWGNRAVALGYQWRYAPDVAVSHPARRDWPELERKWRRMVDEAYAMTKEKPFGRLRWVFRSWLILFSPFFHTVIVLRSIKLKRWDIKLKASGVLFRLRWWRFQTVLYRVICSAAATCL